MHKGQKSGWFELFFRISVELTGFTAFELRSTGMLEEYYNKVSAEENKKSLKLFIDEAGSIMAQYDGDKEKLRHVIQAGLVNSASCKDLTRQIILLWYTGIWPEGGVPKMVSTAAYIRGLIWRAADTHPAGALQPGYGSWAERPLE
jgi:hypothetical protein